MGPESIKPNMHFQCHLVEYVRDHGPTHVFWLFAFERYNGILGSFPNNQKTIEVQLMERFELESHLHRLLLTVPSILPQQVVAKILRKPQCHTIW